MFEATFMPKKEIGCIRTCDSNFHYILSPKIILFKSRYRLFKLRVKIITMRELSQFGALQKEKKDNNYNKKPD